MPLGSSSNFKEGKRPESAPRWWQFKSRQRFRSNNSQERENSTLHHPRDDIQGRDEHKTCTKKKYKPKHAARDALLSIPALGSQQATVNTGPQSSEQFRHRMLGTSQLPVKLIGAQAGAPACPRSFTSSHRKLEIARLSSSAHGSSRVSLSRTSSNLMNSIQEHEGDIEEYAPRSATQIGLEDPLPTTSTGQNEGKEARQFQLAARWPRAGDRKGKGAVNVMPRSQSTQALPQLLSQHQQHQRSVSYSSIHKASSDHPLPRAGDGKDILAPSHHIESTSIATTSEPPDQASIAATTPIATQEVAITLPATTAPSSIDGGSPRAEYSPCTSVRDCASWLSTPCASRATSTVSTMATEDDDDDDRILEEDDEENESSRKANKDECGNGSLARKEECGEFRGCFWN